eukprot:scaffold273112_cov35-Attheya_sp.AAC.1
MRLVLPVPTLVFLWQSDVTFQSYPLFLCRVYRVNSDMDAWRQSMRLVPAVLTPVAFLESGGWLSS